jgi:hypothetical protein
MVKLLFLADKNQHVAATATDTRRGTMRMRIVLLSCVFMLLELAAFAQNEFPKFEVAVDYSYARFNPSHIYIKNSYSLDGGGGSFDFNFDKYLGLKVEFEGYGSNTQNFSAPAGTKFCPLGCTANIQGNLFTYQDGPQVVGEPGGSARLESCCLAGHTPMSTEIYRRFRASPPGARRRL